MTAQIIEITPPCCESLSAQIRSKTILGQARTPAALVAAVENLRTTVPDADLILAAWRQAETLPEGRRHQVIEEIDLILA